jgi:asparagine synthase (glutamine-hydrolysing)
MPYQAWVRGDLMALVHDTLLSQRALARGYFNKKGIEELLLKNVNSGAYPKEVFSLLVLELWHKEFIDNQFRKS